jgi:hypothetical protein
MINDKHVTGPVTVDKSGDIVNHLRMARTSASQHDWGTLGRLVESVLLMDPDCSDAWYMKAFLSLTTSPYLTSSGFQTISSSGPAQMPAGSFDSNLSKGDNGVNRYGIFSKDDISECWGAYTITISMVAVKNSLLVSSIPYLPIRLNGMEEAWVYKDRPGKLGVEAGPHTLSLDMGFLSDKRTFTVSGDTDVEVRFSEDKFHRPKAEIVILSEAPRPSEAAASEERPAKKGWWGRR